MEKHTKGNKICTVCGASKPLSAFLISSIGYAKNYSKICKSCRIKQSTKRFITHAEDDEEGGGKISGLVIDYEAKLAMQQQQEEEKEAKEEAKEEDLELEDESQKLKETEKEKKEKTRISKNIVDRLAKLLSKKKSKVSPASLQTLREMYEFSSVLDGISTAGALKSLGPEWGKRMADILRFSGTISLISLAYKQYESFSGKISESNSSLPKTNELLQATKDIINPHF